MILGGDLDLLGEEVHDGLVAAVVPVGELLDEGAGRHGDDLVAEADAEDGKPAEKGADRLDGLGNRDGVAGAVGEEDAVGLVREGLFGRGVPGDDRDLAAGLGKALGDAYLLAAVVGDDAVCVVGRGGVHVVGFRRRDVRHVVVVRDVLGRADARDEALAVEVEGGDGRPHGAALADAQGEGAGVHALDGDDPALAQEVWEAHDALPVARRVAHVMAHESAQGELAGLHIDFVDAVVAELRIGEGHDLAGIGGIAHDFLVSHHRGVEDDLSERFALRTRGSPEKAGPVLEREKRPRMPAVIDQWVHDVPPSLFSAGDHLMRGAYPQKREPRHAATLLPHLVVNTHVTICLLRGISVPSLKA